MAGPMSSEQIARGAETLELLRKASESSLSEREHLYGRVVTLNLPVAESIARRYAGRGEPPEDLTQVAALALLNAVHRFDPDRGQDFLSLAVPTSRRMSRAPESRGGCATGAAVPAAASLGAAPAVSALLPRLDAVRDRGRAGALADADLPLAR